MASAAHPLLASEGDSERGTEERGAASGARPWSPKLWAAAGMLLLASMGCLLAGTRGRSASPAAAAPVTGGIGKAPTDLLSGWGDAACYQFTGGTCHVFDCKKKRHATCSWGNCYCPTGCTGADGNCRRYMQSYLLVAKSVRIRNTKYKDQYLYAPQSQFLQQLGTTSEKGQYADLWNIYQLPGKDYEGHRNAYFLSPVEFPEYTAGVTVKATQRGVPKVELYHLTSRWAAADIVPFNPGTVMHTLCRPRERPDTIRISVVEGQAVWFVSPESWEVFGSWQTQPGDDGHWTTEPPVNISLSLC